MFIRTIAIFSFICILACQSAEVEENAVVEPAPKTVQTEKSAADVKNSGDITSAETQAKISEEVEKKTGEKPVPRPVKTGTLKKKPAKKIVPIKRPEIVFDSVTIDWGEMISGDKRDFKFAFRNSGKSDLLVTSATATCGCTIPSYPFLPIAPGETGFIGVNYNSVGKTGHQKATISVVTNAQPAIYKLYVEGEVKEKEEKK